MLSSYPVSCPHENCHWTGSLVPSLLRGGESSEIASMQRAWFHCPHCLGDWEVRIANDKVSVLPPSLADVLPTIQQTLQSFAGPEQTDVTSDVLAVLLAGGSGTRLEPLTRHRAKPAVPFGGAYRIVDFALSNCLNSRLGNVLMLPQYKSLSLERHVSQGWTRFFHPELGQRLEIASPQQRVDSDWYLGTANAVYQNVYSIEGSGAGVVLVLAADHVYKMDYRRILAFHRGHGDVATVATIRCPAALAAGQFGVVEVDSSSLVKKFQEKPQRPAEVPGDEGVCLASMGIYVFDARFLVEELRRNAAQVDPGSDFGHHVLPGIIGRKRVHAYEHGGTTGRGEYWRDVGTVDAYFQAHVDLLSAAPELDLYGKAWPTYSFQPNSPPPRVALASRPAGRAPSAARPNVVANGTTSSGWLSGAVVGFDCRIEDEAIVEGSILFDGVTVGRGAEVRRAILDKMVQVRPGACVGLDGDGDRRRGFVISEGGITCVPRGAVVARDN